MKVKKIGGKGDILELEFEGVSPAYINTLRRAILEEVPTLAIEIVEFKQNSSILYDEIVAHRMGLIPLTTDLKEYSLPSAEEMETQEFHARSSVKATLTTKGPCTVYAKDLKFKDPKVKPVHPDTPIAQLLEGQEIELIATAVLGIGREHAKWAPGLAYYHEIQKWKGKSLLTADEHTQRKKGAMKGIDESELTGRTGHYYFRLECWGQLKPKVVLASAVERTNALLKEFDGLLKA